MNTCERLTGITRIWYEWNGRDVASEGSNSVQGERLMKWKYFIPHVWDSTEDKTTWEDVFVLPEKKPGPGTERKSVWVTVDALGLPDREDSERMETFKNFSSKLGEKDHYIDRDQGDMIVRAESFNLKELLGYIEIFIRETFGDDRPELSEGTVEDFRGTHPHIDFLESLGKSADGSGKDRSH